MQPILTINLTTQEIGTFIVPVEWERDYLGGASLGARLLYDFLTPQLDPLSPASPLLVLNGPLSGTSGPTVGRFVVCGKSPATGLWAESNCGGHWASAVRVQVQPRALLRRQDELVIFLRIGHASLKKQNVDVNDLVRQVLEKFAPEVSGRAIEFRIERLPDCMADAELLKTAYRQLIANAIKFTRSRNSARIELGAVNQSGQTCYFLRDNGIGFDLKHASKLFGVFQRLHPEGDEEGTGMGLAIARRIIERHGGRIWAEAEVDKGATFFFTMQ